MNLYKNNWEIIDTIGSAEDVERCVEEAHTMALVTGSREVTITGTTNGKITASATLRKVGA